MYRYIPYLLLLGWILTGCSRNESLPDQVDAHYIRYRVDYLQDTAGDIPTRILPGYMDAYYSKYFVWSRIDGFLNQFSLVQVADLKKKEVTTLLNFFGNKFCYTGKQGELPAGILPLEHPRIIPTREKEWIAGLESEKLEVRTDTGDFAIYCTKDIDIRKPNITTPYYTVDYPLSDFRIQLSLLKMHLRAVEYNEETIDSELFEIPEEYTVVSRSAMEQIINSLFTKE